MPDRRPDKIRSGAFWSGTITFGLVSIPVDLFPANRTQRVSLRMLAPDGTPLRRRYFCPKENITVSREEIVRGYEVEKDRFVVVTDEELEALEPKKSREIDLRRFVPVEQIDPMYFDRAYFLVPTGDTQKPYRLLAGVMESTRRAGIATFVMRSKEYLVAIFSENGLLRAETLRFADEIRTPDDLGLPSRAEVPDAVVSEMDREIRAAAADALDPTELEDERSKALLNIIAGKIEAGEGVIQPPREVTEDEEEGGKVIDIMDVLKRSIEKAGSAASDSAKRGGGGTSGRISGSLRAKTKKELYEQAQQLDVPGRSGMGKDELIAAIRRALK